MELGLILESELVRALEPLAKRTEPKGFGIETYSLRHTIEGKPVRVLGQLGKLYAPAKEYGSGPLPSAIAH
jgi:hypothetical protein